jgi:hypothetical protein
MYNLVDSDIKEIKDIKLYQYKIIFGSLTEEQNKKILSIVSKTTNLDVLRELFYYLLDNSIPFDLKYRWNGTWLLLTIKNYILFRKVKKEISEKIKSR